MADEILEPAIMSKFLEKPTTLREQVWPDNTTPLVSISCITYNHEKFIRDAIEGFINQKTTFPVEILIHDDASTDGTTDIIKEYERKYPKLIKPIYQSENQFSKGKSVGSNNRTRAIGSYIALCEGDDYWTDPLKLQKQTYFLENNKNYSMVCTNYSIVDENKHFINLEAWKGDKTKSCINQEDILGKYTPQTLTVLLRNSCLKKIDTEFSNYNFPNGDVALFSAITAFGPCYFINEITGCYRENKEGIWTQKNTHQKLVMRYRTFKSLLLFFSKEKELREIIIHRLIIICRVLLIISFKKGNLSDVIIYLYLLHLYYFKLLLSKLK